MDKLKKLLMANEMSNLDSLQGKKIIQFWGGGIKNRKVASFEEILSEVWNLMLYVFDYATLYIKKRLHPPLPQ